MRFKLFNIVKGSHEFPLRDYNIYNFDIKTVNFVTDKNDYELKLFKSDIPYYHFYTKFTKDEQLNPYYFTIYRDGMVYLKIESSCDGILEFKYEEYNYRDNIFTINYKKFRENAVKRFYLQWGWRIKDGIDNMRL